jgi:hypothetical protein
MSDMTLTHDEADDIVYSTSIPMQTISEHRWYNKCLVVFTREDELLGFHYLAPASELQEDQDRYESDPVQLFPVTAREVITTVYEATREVEAA